MFNMHRLSQGGPRWQRERIVKVTTIGEACTRQGQDPPPNGPAARSSVGRGKRIDNRVSLFLALDRRTADNLLPLTGHQEHVLSTAAVPLLNRHTSRRKGTTCDGSSCMFAQEQHAGLERHSFQVYGEDSNEPHHASPACIFEMDSERKC